MPLDVSKYAKIKKKKKPTCIRLLKIFFKTIINFIKIDIGKYFKFVKQKNNEEGIKKTLTFLFIAFLWFAFFFVVQAFSEDTKISSTVAFWALSFIAITHHSTIQNYKHWEMLGETDEFNRKFCENWHPNLLGYLIVYFIGIKYLTTFEFFVFLFFAYCLEMWDRRYITTNIKQELILKKLKQQEEQKIDLL